MEARRRRWPTRRDRARGHRRRWPQATAGQVDSNVDPPADSLDLQRRPTAARARILALSGPIRSGPEIASVVWHASVVEAASPLLVA